MKTSWLSMSALAIFLAACGGSKPSDPPEPAAKAHEEHGEHAGESAHIKLTDAQLQQANIRLAQAGPAEIRESLPLYGVIAPNAERMREVAARYPGIIHSVEKRIGDPVKQGERLASVESNESLETYAVVAPLSGVITARSANPGEQTGDRPLFTVADLSSVWVELSLFPRDVSKVHVGQTVVVRSADSGLSAEGKVVYVAPFGSATNQTLTARVLLDNAERAWPPGLYVTAEVTLAKTRVPLAVRKIALQTLEEQSVVFVQGKEGFAPQPVTTGRSDGDFAEVTAGLQAGLTYVTQNSFILKAELGKGEAGHED